MHMSIITTLALFSFSSCANDESYDYRGDWAFFEPDLLNDTTLLHANVTWYADESVPDKLLTGLRDAAEEWRLVMGCSYVPREQQSPAQVDIQFSCTPIESQRATVTRGENVARTMYVDLEPEYCSNGGIALAEYAWIRALGFPEQNQWVSSVGNGFRASCAADGRTISGIKYAELDGFRIWAKNAGAPGCGANEPGWSWVTEPDRYKTAPNETIVNEWLHLSPADQQASNILPRLRPN